MAVISLSALFSWKIVSCVGLQSLVYSLIYTCRPIGLFVGYLVSDVVEKNYDASTWRRIGIVVEKKKKIDDLST